MSTLVTIAVSATAQKPVQVLVQSVRDAGRERHPNGQHEIPAGESRDFLVHEGQCLRVSEGDE